MRSSKSMDNLSVNCHGPVMPGLTDNLFLCQFSYLSISSNTAGLGPTIDISPVKTFINCGISSIEYFLKKFPNLVTRGSLCNLKPIPSKSFLSRYDEITKQWKKTDLNGQFINE